MKELLTLSAVVDELKSKIVWNHEMIAQAYGFFEDVVKHNNFLKGTVQLCHFIPCKDGKPLSEPIKIGGGIAEQAYSDAMQAYQQAQDAVIFEGWEYVQTGETFYIKNDNWGIDWYGGEKPNDFELRLFPTKDKTFGTMISRNIKTYSDLASATQGNTLKMRK